LRISELYQQKKPVISFEIFPPKREADVESIYQVLEEMAALSPDFISVTYGAGGAGSVNKTAEIAGVIEGTHRIPAMAHLTCITSSSSRIEAQLAEMKARGVRNVLALRGDRPAGVAEASPHYLYAEDLIRAIRRDGGFCIGGACYPEGHIECEDDGLSLTHLKRKQDAGADFLISQLFFENDKYFSFLEQTVKAGITLPISAGVMPILGRPQIERMIFMCGASLPSRIVKLLHRYQDNPEDLRKAGIAYAVEQIDGLLAQGVDGVHIYTMNKPDIARTCLRHIGRV